MEFITTTIFRKIIGLLLSILAVVLFVIVVIPWFLGPSDKLEKADAIIAISGGDTQARTNEAVRLYKEGWAPNLIFSGAAADPNSPSNAEVMQQGAIQAGVPQSAIDVGELALNTIGNAEESAEIIRKNNYKTVILVTSKYHERRAALEFARLLGDEVKIIRHPAPNDKNWPANSWWARPYSLVLGGIETVKTLYVWGDYAIRR